MQIPSGRPERLPSPVGVVRPAENRVVIRRLRSGRDFPAAGRVDWLGASNGFGQNLFESRLLRVCGVRPDEGRRAFLRNRVTARFRFRSAGGFRPAQRPLASAAPGGRRELPTEWVLFSLGPPGFFPGFLSLEGRAGMAVSQAGRLPAGNRRCYRLCLRRRVRNSRADGASESVFQIHRDRFNRDRLRWSGQRGRLRRCCGVSGAARLRLMPLSKIAHRFLVGNLAYRIRFGQSVFRPCHCRGFSPSRCGIGSESCGCPQAGFPAACASPPGLRVSGKHTGGTVAMRVFLPRFRKWDGKRRLFQIGNTAKPRNRRWIGSTRSGYCGQPVFRRPAAMPLIVPAMARFTSSVSSPARLRRSKSTWIRLMGST